ncbi:hypothetical protein ES319_D13G228500v1 [Gossypium barbadense]|uniref:DUF4408 domain-containing protein n=2 Tax=Gossypium TaxID=3633 RepID=A0A5J5NUF3_GOSBA|nr:hypothetical protein ES319_D13G228500v1 [Gossypium barbadense]TYG38665.1 hypothetical protein ES288_D13G241600v1 [Gossypium darwinii]
MSYKNPHAETCYILVLRGAYAKINTNLFTSCSSSSRQYFPSPKMFSDMSDLRETWLSPTTLFLFLDIMVGTIFFISRITPHRTPYVADYGNSSSSSSPSLDRSLSFFGRVTSFNFSTYSFPISSQDVNHHFLQTDDGSAAHQVERAPSILERVKSNFYKYSPQSPETDCIEPAQQSLISRAPSLLERVKSFYKPDTVKPNETEPTVTDSNGSETGLSSVHGEIKRIQSEPMVRQRELPEKMKKSRRKVEKEVEMKRSASTGIEETTPFEDDDHVVDAKAEDFIEKFKQQLKLQRLNSLLPYRYSKPLESI